MARLRIAKTGYNISSDLRYLSLDSNYSSLMIIDDVDVAGSATEYAHGLGYLPTTFEFFNYGTQWFPMESAVYDTSDTLQLSSPSPSIEFDTNKAYFTNTASLPIRMLISGNSASNLTGSGKNTASGKIKIAKSGLDVENITDIRQFNFCSGLDTIKKDLAKSGTTTLTSTGSFTKVTISHGLDYVPMVTARITSNSYDSDFNGRLLPQNWFTYDFAPVGFYVTSSNIVFYSYSPSMTVNIKYNLYRNKIA